MVRSRKQAKKPQRPKKKPREEDAFLKEPGFQKHDITKKLIPLSVLSGKDAERAAERTVDNVFTAILHVLTEGDLSIADFGRFEASKGKKGEAIRIFFTPAGKLKRAVEARMSVPPPAPNPEVPAATQQESSAQEASPNDPAPQPQPEPAAAPAAESELQPASPPVEVSDAQAPSAQQAPASCEAEKQDETEVKALDSVSLESRTIVSNGEEFGIAENLKVVDINGSLLNFDDLQAALRYLSLVSQFIILSKTEYRIHSASVSVINSLQLRQYKE